MMNLRIAVAAGLLAALPMLSPAADEKPVDAGTVPLSDLVARVHKKSGQEFILEPSVGAMRVSLAGMNAERIDYPMLLAVLRDNGLVSLSEKEVVTILPDREARQWPTPRRSPVKSWSRASCRCATPARRRWFRCCGR